ncbi:hypothetical protein C0J29_19960 [Mycobacterium paragordonae]|jgi:uncharacterized protein YhhL (DUF1145 family)|uniref:Carotenoid biosynthesis protein n=1 Tax=Mycobacterium paragordonae TaxID=1389713 RepID=A0A386U8S3_9MYCO|nr:hypothetical protein [Mycobacterium paragordonae]AYE96728.1 hypothetical protein C0J29_19960 [Mycobacterium paragordonae]MDP7734014.1 hypothetical protein [Mycobacterium paragordonae]TDK88080.1 hypothetical protein EI067_27585 [Mycobacterium paragordonae]TDK97368.1 hypothetical protein EUA02_11535 [Mycobacterium paragordonae]TDL11013.1 hypothetical protein EUA05_02535 [Mycobacterium paragordonae]
MLDKAVLAACVIYLALSGWALAGPAGMGLPPAAMMVMSAAMMVLLLGHMWKHLALKLTIAFFATASVLEWAFEQTNISYGGFIWGDIRYGHLGVFSVHVGAVPVAVPVMMAAILWPTYATVNLILDGRVVVDPRTLTWWQTIWRCALYGMVHSWLMLVTNAISVKFDIYHWVGRSLTYSADDAFLGDPTAPLGWAMYVFITMLVFTFVMLPLLGRNTLQHNADRPLTWSDGAPIVFFGVMGLLNYFNPVNLTAGNIALWTLGFFAALTGYRFVTLMRDHHEYVENRSAEPELVTGGIPQQ